MTKPLPCPGCRPPPNSPMPGLCLHQSTLWCRDRRGDTGGEPSQRGHPRQASCCYVSSLTLSEEQRCRWTRSLSLCSRQEDVPGSKPSHGPFCSRRKILEQRQTRREKQREQLKPPKLPSKGFRAIFHYTNIPRYSVKPKENDLSPKDLQGMELQRPGEGCAGAESSWGLTLLMVPSSSTRLANRMDLVS